MATWHIVPHFVSFEQLPIIVWPLYIVMSFL